MVMPVTTRDQSPRHFGPCSASSALSTCSVDFEWGNNGLETGIVNSALNLATRKPVYCCGTAKSPKNTVHNSTTFATWYNDSPFTITIDHNLTLTNSDSSPRLYSYTTSSYFPIDGQGWDVPAGKDEYLALDGNYHNFHFANEAHGRFAYKGGETFSFTGDDDVFVFINNKLALDLGGVHGPDSSSFSLDDIATSFSLTIGNNYRFDFFWNERHTLGSDVALTTSIEIYCSYYDWCNVCDGDGQSCCTTGDCDDGNPCTEDLCAVLVAPTVACQHLQINCTAPDICHTSACDIGTGECANTEITCPTSSDLCQLSSCDPTQGGCIYTAKTCDDDQGACTIKSCNATTGLCQFAAVVCNDNNACTTDTCDSVKGCVYTTMSCDDGDACTVDSCNKTTGCVHTVSSCGCGVDLCPTTDLCQPNVCSGTSSSYVCTITPLDCDDGNPCTDDSCTTVDDTALCVNTEKTCANLDACNLGYCNATSGACYTVATDCDDGIKCTIDSCNANNGTCSHVLRTCNDDNECTTDTCYNTAESEDGCVFTPITCSNTTCSYSTCDPLYGCIYTLKTQCDLSNTSFYCLSGACDEAIGCYNTTRTCLLSNELSDPSHWVDDYQNYWKTTSSGTKYKDEDCFTAVCDTVVDKCVVEQRSPWSSTCAFAYLTTAEQAAVITGGVIAGIVVAAVVFAALAGFGAKKGYDAWVRMQDERMGAAQGNPMYAPSSGSGNNRLYA